MDTVHEFNSLKKNYNDIVEEFGLNGKTQAQLISNGSAFKRDLLAEALVSVLDICNQTFELFEKNMSTPNTVDDIVTKVKDAIGTLVPSLVTDIIKQNVSNKSEVPTAPVPGNHDKHVIVLKDKDNDSTKFNERTWSNVVNGTLNTELQRIPVNRSVLNKDGHGCLFFPSKEAQAQAKSALEPLFNVTANSKPAKRVMPKIKVFDVDTDTYADKDTLRQSILHKNTEIGGMIEDADDLSVILIDTANKFAILKVSPTIRRFLISRGRIFVGMNSHRVRDHFHPLQCFACQGHGHKQGSEVCKLFGKQTKTCLYCSGNHLSRECEFKKQPDKHVCANCKCSDNPEHRNNASHKSTSFRCPFVIKEVNSLIQRTTGITDTEAKKLKIKMV